MKKKDQLPEDLDCPFCTDESAAPKKKEKKNPDEVIYEFLDRFEKIATFAAAVNQKKTKKAKKEKKKNKKLYKIDKKTGVMSLKKIKKDKIQKPMKRYKPPKKK